MLSKVRAAALEKFAGDTTLADEAVKSFVKTAFDMGEFGKGVATSMGRGLGGVVVGMGIAGVGNALKGAEAGVLHTKFLSTLETAIANNRILKEANKAKVMQYAETIYKFAPHVATDVNLLTSILANAIHGDGIDPMTIKSITDLEGRYVESQTSVPFSPKTYI